MALPILPLDITSPNSLGHQANMEGQLCKVWDGLHVSPRTAPPKRASSAHIVHGSCALVS